MMPFSSIPRFPVVPLPEPVTISSAGRRVMNRNAWVGVLVAWGALTSAGMHLNAAAPPQQTRVTSPTPAQLRTTLNRYCVGCHSDRLRTGGLSLEKLDLTNVPENALVWEKVIAKLRGGAMPPAPAARPDRATYAATASFLEDALDRAAEAKPNPGRPAVHRLNRAEYANAIRDLLALDIDSRSLLPADDSGYGFDNIADVLSVSPGLLERYMTAARRISRTAVGDAAMRPVVETYSAARYLVQDDRVDERLPFGSRGGIAIPHYFPLDGKYTLKIRLQRTWRDEIRGLARPHALDVRLDRTSIGTFTIGGA